MEPNQESANLTEPDAVEQNSANQQNVEDTTNEVSESSEQTESSITPEQGKAQSYEKPKYEVEAEWRRKYTELVDNLPKMIEENLSKVKNTPQQEEYTIEQLEQFALQNPNLRPQVEAEKLKIYQRETARQIEERDKKIESKRQFEMVRMQSEQALMNDPAFKDCFTQNALGQKQWNMGHPLTNIIGELMRNPEISSRPDALIIAGDIAYGRYMREVSANTAKKAQTLQATVKREQKKTLVEGGTPNGSVGGDSFSKAKAELAKTGSKQAAQTAILEYMKRAGLGRQG